jgi:hypothetical protein
MKVRNLKSGVLFIILVSLFLTLSVCSQGKKPNSSRPGIGSINGTRFVIPAEYKFFPVEYEGDDIWAQPPKRHAPGPDVPIRGISLLLHYPDIVPLNKENRSSWDGRKGAAAKDNEWIVAGIEPTREIGKNSALWFSRFIDGRMDAQISWRSKRDWYFEKQPDLVFGLVNEKKIGPDYSKISVDNVEVFYDEDRSKTYIKCGAGAGGTKFCNQEFFIEKYGLLVDAFYAKENLRSWNMVQIELTRLILSFAEKK